MRWIELVGWAIYPIGFVIGNLLDISNAASTMNAIYNLADLVNKTAFGLVIWAAAKRDSENK
jgi:bacteriorhodopsin